MPSCLECPNCALVRDVWALDVKTGRLRKVDAYVCVVYNSVLALERLDEQVAQHYARNCTYYGVKFEKKERDEVVV